MLLNWVYVLSLLSSCIRINALILSRGSLSYVNDQKVKRKTREIKKEACFIREDHHELSIEEKKGRNIVLIFPGIDGTGKIGNANAKSLSEYFDEVWTLRFEADDRISTNDIVILALEKMEKKKAILIGESTGAIGAISVALKAPTQIKALIIANPATSYARSFVAYAAPLLPRIPRLAYESLPAIVAPLFGKPNWYDPILSKSSNQERSLLDRSKALAEALPPRALAWREKELVRAGADAINRVLETKNKVKNEYPVALIAGGRDVLLPSVDEVKRLSKYFDKTQIIINKNGGHVLLDELNLCNILVDMQIIKLPPPLTRINAFLEPKSQLERILLGAKRIVSPVFFSTNVKSGQRNIGLSELPLSSLSENKKVILVGNHQLFGLDGPLIVEEIVRTRRILIPALVYPPLLEDESPLAPIPYPLPGSAATLRRFGAIPAGAKSLIRALENQKAALVFPGGAREVFKRRGERYELQWPAEPTLIKIAMKQNATIIPFSAVGLDDFFADFIADSDDLLANSFTGPFFQERVSNLPSFVNNDVFVPPLMLPQVNGPRRSYFLFHRPLDFSDFQKTNSTNQEEALLHFYAQVKKTVQHGISLLLQARKDDPFEGNLFSRLAYESLLATRAPISFELPNQEVLD